eukprot:5983592-Prymnesium_polylepis.1
MATGSLIWQRLPNMVAPSGSSMRPRSAPLPSRAPSRLPAAAPTCEDGARGVNSLAYPAHARDNPAACTLLGG